MRSQIEAAAALVVALGLHTSFFLVHDSGGGAQSSGQGGDALVSIEAAPPSLSDLVAEWEEVPEPVSLPATPTPPPPVTETPPQVARPQPEPAPQMQRPEFDMPSVPEIPSAPVAELPPPPPPEPEPVVEPEPEPELEPAVEPEPEPVPSPEIPAVRPAPRPPVPAQPEPTQQAQPEQPERVAPARPASAGQRAAGSGGGPIAGDGGSSEGATRNTAREVDPRVSWGSAIRARIERHKRYPRSAGTASGTTIVRLVVTRSGQLAGIALQRSSGNSELDQAALQAVQAVGRFPAAPSAITAASTTFNLPINFSR